MKDIDYPINFTLKIISIKTLFSLQIKPNEYSLKKVYIKQLYKRLYKETKFIKKRKLQKKEPDGFVKNKFLQLQLHATNKKYNFILKKIKIVIKIYIN